MSSEIKKPEGEKVDSVPRVAKIVGDTTPGAATDAAREDLEQRRNILQNIKDLDFQNKKNQEDITTVSQKVENLSKDLDDLVSLYEIVSEQMNPFVGLSKVTKKRIDALENFTKEVETVKTRLGDLESMVDKIGSVSSETMAFITAHPGTPVTEARPEVAPLASDVSPVVPSSSSPAVAQPLVGQSSPATVPSPSPTMVQPSVGQNGTDKDIDEILSRVFESLLIDENIDMMINDFFITLK